MLDGDGVQRKSGFIKVKKCCLQALRDGLEWVWVDTCCIDKTCSSELSETINSMFKFYEQSIKCYAILSDISSDQWMKWVEAKVQDNHTQDQSAITPEQVAQFPIFSSRWWSRGWTLQELIAPYDVEFYSQRVALSNEQAKLQTIDPPEIRHSLGNP